MSSYTKNKKFKIKWPLAIGLIGIVVGIFYLLLRPSKSFEIPELVSLIELRDVKGFIEEPANRNDMILNLKRGSRFDLLVLGNSPLAARVCLDAASSGIRVGCFHEEDWKAGKSSLTLYKNFLLRACHKEFRFSACQELQKVWQQDMRVANEAPFLLRSQSEYEDGSHGSDVFSIFSHIFASSFLNLHHWAFLRLSNQSNIHLDSTVDWGAVIPAISGKKIKYLSLTQTEYSPFRVAMLERNTAIRKGAVALNYLNVNKQTPDEESGRISVSAEDAIQGGKFRFLANAIVTILPEEFEYISDRSRHSEEAMSFRTRIDEVGSGQLRVIDSGFISSSSLVRQIIKASGQEKVHIPTKKEFKRKKAPLLLLGGHGYSKGFGNELMETYKISKDVAQHLVENYGVNSVRICDIGIEHGLLRKAHPDLPILKAEIGFLVLYEQLVHLKDAMNNRLDLRAVPRGDLLSLSQSLAEVMALFLKKDNQWQIDQVEVFLKESKIISQLTI